MATGDVADVVSICIQQRTLTKSYGVMVRGQSTGTTSDAKRHANQPDYVIRVGEQSREMSGALLSSGTSISGWMITKYNEDSVVTVRPPSDEFGDKLEYVCLRILPDPVDDTEDEYDLFVKDYNFRGKPEPRSYDQGHTAYEGQVTGGLEKNYPYIQKLRVPGNVMLAVHREML